MPVIESTQHKLDRIRPPRVQITYDVEIGNAIEKIELPFVMGILADLSGPTATPTPADEWEFIEIDRDNFNQILRSIAPTLENIEVENVIPKSDGSLPDPNTILSIPQLKFTHMDDFLPGQIIEQVDELRTLLEERQALKDMLAKLANKKAALTPLLQNIVNGA